MGRAELVDAAHLEHTYVQRISKLVVPSWATLKRHRRSTPNDTSVSSARKRRTLGSRPLKTSRKDPRPYPLSERQAQNRIRSACQPRRSLSLILKARPPALLADLSTCVSSLKPCITPVSILRSFHITQRLVGLWLCRYRTFILRRSIVKLLSSLSDVQLRCPTWSIAPSLAHILSLSMEAHLLVLSFLPERHSPKRSPKTFKTRNITSPKLQLL